jgi:predicted dehydrogenase
MKHATRREFLKQSALVGLTLSMPRLVLGADANAKAAGPNSEVRVAVVGMGGIDVVGGVGGRGRKLIAWLREVPGVKIVALCDVDKDILDQEVQAFKKRGGIVATYIDFRRVLEDKSIDAVVLATPNHVHALQTVWACQAGKDVYVEKPFSYDIWEGRQMVAAARKYGRMVQVGTQRRASQILPPAFAYLRSGQLGAIRCIHALVYRAREPLGKVTTPTPVPASVDYDLWCGPAPKTPVMRKQFHYEWHWYWATGNGEIGNNGAHVIDISRWALGQNQPPPRVISIGGRLAFDDTAETPNTQIAFIDYKPAPIICEVRNIQAGKGANAMGKFRNQDKGIVISCEGGYFAGDFTGGAVYDNQNKKIKDFQDGKKSPEIETLHMANFITAVRNRKAADLYAEAQDAHLSTLPCHMANISHRLGQQAPVGTIQETIRGNGELTESFERCREYLKLNGVDLGKTPATLGPWVSLDPKTERFTGEMADRANAYLRREYRAPFVVPQIG